MINKTPTRTAGALRTEIADENYRVIQRDDDSFAVEVIRTGALPQTAAGFATQAEADAWIAQDKRLIPVDRKVDWYARGVGGAAAREIKRIPAGRQKTEESKLRPAGIRQAADPFRTPTNRWRRF